MGYSTDNGLVLAHKLSDNNNTNLYAYYCIGISLLERCV